MPATLKSLNFACIVLCLNCSRPSKTSTLWYGRAICGRFFISKPFLHVDSEILRTAHCVILGRGGLQASGFFSHTRNAQQDTTALSQERRERDRQPITLVRMRERQHCMSSIISELWDFLSVSGAVQGFRISWLIVAVLCCFSRVKTRKIKKSRTKVDFGQIFTEPCDKTRRL